MDLNLKKKIFFVIPAYNEGKVILKVLNKLLFNGFSNLIIIDDGSSDNTSELVEKLEKKEKGVILLEHVINRGQGAALKTGIDYCLKQDDCKYIVTYDSDGQHRIEDLDDLVAPLESGKYELSLGSRFIDQGKKKTKMPFSRLLTLKGGILFTIIISGKKYTDTHNGYRVFTKSAAKKMRLIQDDFSHASEMLEEIARKKLKFIEVPVKIIYTDYSLEKGQSAFNALRIVFKTIIRRFFL